MNSKLLFERSLHEPSGGYLQKRHSDHGLTSSIPGTRVYPYPGTTQEPVRNSQYHHSGTHLAGIPHHLNYLIGTNSGHTAAVGPQSYRDNNYSVERHEFSPIDRYRNRNESNDIHHSSGGTHSGSNPSTGATGHSQPPLVRRRPSLLPHVQQNEYNILGSGGAMSSPYLNVNRDRYDIYRYTAYPENRAKGTTLQSSSITMPSTTVSQHSGPSPIHMVQHGLHGLPVGHPHQQQAMVSSQHLSQSHVIQDIQDMNVNKRPRLGFTNDSRPPIHQPLLIDTRDVVEVKKEPAYTPQVEAISPTLPNDDVRQDMSPLKSTKDELLQNINKIDREILQTESQISKLRRKHQELEMVTSKPAADNQELQDNSGFESQLSVAQIIYSDNKAKTFRAHSQFDKLGPAIELPLYNQPSDTAVYHENKRNFMSFKKNLIQFFKKRFKEKQLRERYLTDTYDRLMLSWLKKLEKKETNPPKKAKDIKLREYFEKQFPELRKQREDKERFSRVGQRIRSDAELEEIMDGLQEQELEDKKMRSYAVIPPIILDSRYKKHNYINKNGAIEDPMAEYKERQMLNIWTEQEKELFREKYLLHPKNFGQIASFLDRKSVTECVQYYYLSKKNENYKQLLRKQVKKRTRALVKAQQQQQQQAIAAQAQNRPSPVVSRPQTSEELTKTTTTVVTTNTITTTTTTSVSLVVTTSTTSASGVPNETVAEVGVSESSVLKADSNVSENNDSKCDNISDNEENNENNGSTCDTSHQCCLCESNVDSKSRAVTLSNLNLYNISNNKFKPGMRVCLMCHFKSVRRHCPLPSCKTPRRKVKRLKSLPQLWFDMSAETRQLYANELNVPLDVRTACPRCVMRISRRIGVIPATDQTNMNHNSDNSSRVSFSDFEIDQIKIAIKEFGKNWSTIAAQIPNKTETDCKDFYLKNKYSLNLNKIYKEFCIASGKSGKNESDSEEYWNDLSDGDSEETSSAEEGNDRCNSDTASASSPISKTIDEMDTTSKPIVVKTDNRVDSSRNNNFQEDFNKLQDYKGLSASQTSLKSDYDSSATMSADEGQGNGETDRLSSSPAVSLPPRANSAMPVFPPSNIYFQHQTVDKLVRPASHDAAFAVDMVNKMGAHTHSPTVLRTTDPIISSRQKVPPFLINPNAPSTPHSSNTSNIVQNVSKEEPTCVRDLIYQAIEMSLQSPLKALRPNSQPMVSNETNKLESNEAVSPNPFPLPIIKRENVMDVSKADSSRESPSRLCYKNVDIQRPEGLAVMASYTQHLSPSPNQSSNPFVVEPDDYEVQDLSKKDRRIDSFSPRNYSPSLKDRPLSHRNEYPYGLIPAAHSNQNRGSTPLSTNDTVIETKDNYNLMKHPDSRHLNTNFVMNERMSAQDSIRSRSSPSNRLNKVSKSSPVPPPPPLINSGKPNQSYCQLSPQLYKEKVVPVSAPSGGSITQGTPGVQQPNSYMFPQNINRYEGLLRPSGVHREGSITLGTPLMTGNPNSPMDPNRRRNDIPITEQNRPEMLTRNNAMYEPSAVEQMYRRSSPPTASHPYSPSFHQNMYKPKPPFQKESQLSSNQIMIDFNTSKQMLTRRGSNSSEKDGRSSTPIHSQIESRSQNDPKNAVPTRMPNPYPNYNQITGQSSVIPIPSSVYTREGQPQMMGPSEGHMNQWSARHSPMGAQSPNYSRQNVIQHWNAPNPKQSVIQTPKSSSPRDYRTEAVSPVAHPEALKMMRSSASPQVPVGPPLYSPSHDAFTTLVNAAAAQQSLAVPNIDRRSGSSSGSRSDISIRSNIKDKPSVEGLEKSLMDQMHGRPRNFTENEPKYEDKIKTNEIDSKGYPHNRTPNDEYAAYHLEQRRRVELEQMAELERHRYNRAINESHVNPISQPSLRFSREPFSREHFERELRQPTEPIRPNAEQNFRIKSEDMEQNQEPRHSLPPGMRPPISGLDDEASKLFSQSFQKDNPKMNSSRGQFTAANLIDAIITHQINASTDSPNPKAANSPAISSTPNTVDSPQQGMDQRVDSSLFNRYHNNEKHVIPSHYQNREEVVTIADSPDPDRSYPPNERQPQTIPNLTNSSAKNLSFGDHIATYISKTYTNESRTPTSSIVQIDPRSSPNVYGLQSHSIEQRSQGSTVLEGIAATAVSNASDVNSSSAQSPPHSSWKLRKALQQDKEAKETDERQIIRIIQNVSPKERPVYSMANKSGSPALSHYNVEPISPPNHSSDNSPQQQQMTTTYTPSQTTWSPTAGVHSVVTNRPFYGADSSEVGNASKHSPQTMATNHSNNTNRSNQSPIGLSPLDYVKNRIVEVMRTTSDDTADDLNKRPNHEINSTQQPNEKPIKEEIETKICFNSNPTIDSMNKINVNCLKRENPSPVSEGYKYQNPVPVNCLEPKSSHNLINNIKTEKIESTDRSPPKKVRRSCDQLEKSESSDKMDANPSNSVTIDSKTLSFDCESYNPKVSQSSVPEVIKSEERVFESSNISSSESSKSVNKSNCEVSSLATDDNCAAKPDARPIFPDSPNSAHSPGEMVIDESDNNLTSSLSLNDKSQGESPPTSSSQTTQQSLITTSDVHKNDFKTSLIGSTSSETSSNEVLNQSHSVSSSVIELIKTPVAVSVEASAHNEMTPNYSKSNTLSTQSDSAVNSANSVSSTALTVSSAASNPDFTNKSSVNTSGVSSSIGISCSGDGVTQTAQSSSSSSIQSSAISASGAPTSTTRLVSTPQYEPLSDDE